MQQACNKDESPEALGIQTPSFLTDPLVGKLYIFNAFSDRISDPSK